MLHVFNIDMPTCYFSVHDPQYILITTETQSKLMVKQDMEKTILLRFKTKHQAIDKILFINIYHK